MNSDKNENQIMKFCELSISAAERKKKKKIKLEIFHANSKRIEMMSLVRAKKKNDDGDM